MQKIFLMAAIAAVTVIGAGAGTAELPTFELTGFPITPHQVAVVGGTNVPEQARTPMLVLNGMPASPPSDSRVGSTLQRDREAKHLEADHCRLVSVIAGGQV